MINDLIWRELSNGVWFIMCLTYFVFSFQFYIDLRCNSDRYQLTDRSRVEGLALAIPIYFLAASLRGGYIWLLLLAENAGLKLAVDLRDYGYVMAVAAIVGVSAVLVLMKLQSNKRWGAKVWVTAGLLILITPIVIHLVMNVESRHHLIDVFDWWWHTGNFDPFGRK